MAVLVQPDIKGDFFVRVLVEVIVMFSVAVVVLYVSRDVSLYTR